MPLYNVGNDQGNDNLTLLQYVTANPNIAFNCGDTFHTQEFNKRWWLSNIQYTFTNIDNGPLVRCNRVCSYDDIDAVPGTPHVSAPASPAGVSDFEYSSEKVDDTPNRGRIVGGRRNRRTLHRHSRKNQKQTHKKHRR